MKTYTIILSIILLGFINDVNSNVLVSRIDIEKKVELNLDREISNDYDLYVDNFYLSQDENKNMIWLNYSAGNKGDELLFEMPVKIYFSADTIIDTSDVLIEDDELFLSNRQSVRVYKETSMPENCDGKYFIISLDDEGFINENNETNNISFCQINLAELQNDGVLIKESSAPEISVHPNPVKDKIKIHSDNPYYIIQLYSMQGSLLLQDKINTYSTTINMSKFKSGHYLMKIIYEKNIYTKKILKK